MREKILKNFKGYLCTTCGKVHYRQKLLLYCKNCYSKTIVEKGSFNEFVFFWKQFIKWVQKLSIPKRKNTIQQKEKK